MKSPEMFNDLNKVLIKLNEECAEVIHQSCKIQAHGIKEYDPVSGRDNKDLLEVEIGDVLAYVKYLSQKGIISMIKVSNYQQEKIDKIELILGKMGGN